MIFNSYGFVLFFLVTIFLYFIIPKKLRYIWLLITSYFFYSLWNIEWLFILIYSTLITFFMAKLTEKIEDKKKRKMVLFIGIVLNFSVLFFFKYYNFALTNVNFIFAMLKVTPIPLSSDIMLPIGISFYIFQSTSYLIDVYRKYIPANRNFAKYALFVSFFPSICSGPIERAGNLLIQINKLENLDIYNFERIKYGCAQMIWGFFMKMVISDRIAILVNEVHNNYTMYGSSALILAALFYGIQIYCDFASYSLIAIGCAKIMGINLTNNFDTPYFSSSISEFWRRWHISLSTWFRDYVYIPLGGNRCSKIRKYINLMITFLVSGLWHGASWNFIVWGGLHGFYQIIGYESKGLKEKFNCKIGTKETCFSYKFLKIIITVLLVDFAWIFFRAKGLKSALNYIFCMFTKWDIWTLFDGSIYTWGLDRLEFKILILMFIIFFIVELIRFRKKVDFFEWINDQNWWFRWGFYICIICFIAIFGIYGPLYNNSQFIYFQF